MATLEELFAAMPDAPAGGTHELLIINPDTREVYIPEIEKVLGVEADDDAERKYFQAPRYVGDGIDLSACRIRVAFQNASGTEEGRDGYLVDDVAVNGDYVYFSWRLSPKVCLYKGPVQFAVCAILGNTVAWHTTPATGTVLEGLEVDYTGVVADTSDVLAQLLDLVEAQSVAVEAVGVAQAEAVKSAGADALVEINAAAADAATAIFCEAAGRAIRIDDASDRPLLGLRILGRSTQAGTPTPEAPVEIEGASAYPTNVYKKNLASCASSASNSLWGVALTNKAGASEFTLDGTASSTGYTITTMQPTLAPGTYTCSVYGINDGDAVSIRTYMTGAEIYAEGITPATPKTFTLIEPTRVTVHMEYVEGSVYDEATVRVQIEHGPAATGYEPYEAAQQLYFSKSVGSVTVPRITHTLHGIPVATGGNYTDENGQEWICDEVDLTRGVLVQRIRTVTLDGSKIPSVFADGNNGGTVFGYAYDELGLSIVQNRSNKLCDRLQGPPVVNPQSYKDCEAGRWGFNSDGSNDGFLVMNVGTFETPETAAAWLADNPVEFVYILAAPTETTLTEEELAAFAALHSNKPTTTFLNRSGAYMAVEYVADTKLYIDGKLAELVAAMNA